MGRRNSIIAILLIFIIALILYFKLEVFDKEKNVILPNNNEEKTPEELRQKTNDFLTSLNNLSEDYHVTLNGEDHTIGYRYTYQEERVLANLVYDGEELLQVLNGVTCSQISCSLEEIEETWNQYANNIVFKLYRESENFKIITGKDNQEYLAIAIPKYHELGSGYDLLLINESGQKIGRIQAQDTFSLYDENNNQVGYYPDFHISSSNLKVGFEWKNTSIAYYEYDELNHVLYEYEMTIFNNKLEKIELQKIENILLVGGSFGDHILEEQ